MGLRDDIIADPACAVAYATRDCAELARIRSFGRMRLCHTAVGVGTILDKVDNGGMFLDNLTALGATNRDLYWAMVMINAGRLDLGVEKVQAQLTLLAQGMPQFAAGINALKALGYEPDPYSAAEMADALYNPDGTLK
jgi:hypothetical protein